MFMSFLVVFLLVYVMLNWWIGLRAWQSIVRHIPFLSRKLYWPVFWLIALSYLIGRFGREFLPAGVSLLLTQLGSYWMAFMIYFALALAVIEIALLGGRALGIYPGKSPRGHLVSLVTGLTVLSVVTGIVVYGWWNARSPQVRDYSINIPKQAGQMKDIRVVAVSDLHLGTIVHNGRLLKLVDMINELQPDLILLPGDVVDESPGPFVEQDMMSTFRKLTPRYGIYAVPGNHEYIGGKTGEIIKYLQGAGINVLRDQAVKVAGSFYLVGKDESSRHRFSQDSLPEIKADPMTEVEQSLPVILMEHQPARAGQPDEQGVDLKLSGHTHRGQLFPFNLITGRMYETDWGYLRKGAEQVIVSSGFGTWGPPIRVGSTPEVLKIDIHFGQ